MTLLHLSHLALTSALFVLSFSLTKAQEASLGDGEALLECGEIADLTQLTLCLSRRFSEAQRRGISQRSGYPYQVAPTLPPFLRSPKLRAEEAPEKSYTPVRRIQGYIQPQYRNFLDMDSTVSQRVLEYRPVYGDFAVPVLVHPAPPPAHYEEPVFAYYQKPVKPGTKKFKKAHQAVEYAKIYAPKKEHKYSYVKDQRYKYNDGYATGVEHSNGHAYGRDYYVPANSPIIGDIRRSLLDYTGATDLMEEEPDYLSGSALRQRIKQMPNDYSPFRRNDYFRSKDLDANESQKSKDKPGQNKN